MPQPTPEEKLDMRLMSRLNKAVSVYNLIVDGDRILIGLSGGKDSLCLLELLSRRQRVHRPHFELAALHVRMDNIQYETDTSYLQKFADAHGVELLIRTTRFDASTDRRKTPCFLCSWYRRKMLFNVAQEMGFNKIALGHHQDDIIHTALMSIFYEGQFSTMPARLKLRKMPLSIIRPLCMICEADIKAHAEQKGYQEQKKKCPYDHDSHRTTIRHLFSEIELMNAEARANLWHALNKEGKMVEE